MSEEFAWVVIYMMPITTFLWLLFMWATHEDYKKEHNIKGWSDKDMNIKQLIAITLVSTVVGISGYLVGTYYGAISMLDTMYGNVESELDILESKLKDVNTRDVERKLEEIKTKVLNKVPSKESIAELNKQVDSLNERLLLLSKELMEVHMELEMELSDLEDNTKAFINDKVTKSEEEVKKQFGEMYDKLDVLYKELEEVSILVDKAKETFLGKAIFKENE
jgi:regulator of replication initiation timing